MTEQGLLIIVDDETVEINSIQISGSSISVLPDNDDIYNLDVLCEAILRTVNHATVDGYTKQTLLSRVVSNIIEQQEIE